MSNLHRKLWFCILSGIVITVRAGDTIFQSLPDPRLWDTAFMVEVFADHFNGDLLNTSVWFADDCRGRGSIPTNNEGGLRNIEVSNGTLKLMAGYDPGNADTTCWSGGFESDYTTAEISSLHKRYLYGSFEARCRMPVGQGLFFAYWLWGKGDKFGFPRDEWASEIDIAEKINRNVIHAFHYWPPRGAEIVINHGVKRLKKDTGGWHVYKIIWTPFLVEFFLDGRKTWERSAFFEGRDTRGNNISMNGIKQGIPYRVRNWFPRHGCCTVFQMQLNQEIAGREQMLLPAILEVDYVKVKQFFPGPEIRCPAVLFSSGQAILDADSTLSEMVWSVKPKRFFNGETEGTGSSAYFTTTGNMEGNAAIEWTFKLPSGEIFKARKEFRVKILLF